MSDNRPPPTRQRSLLETPVVGCLIMLALLAAIVLGVLFIPWGGFFLTIVIIIGLVFLVGALLFGGMFLWAMWHDKD